MSLTARFIKAYTATSKPTFTADYRDSSTVSFRSLILSAGLIVVLPIGQESTGKKPLVLLSGELKERATTEGTPVILDNGALRTLATGETLIS